MAGGIVGMILSFGMFIVKIAVITPDTSYHSQTLLSFMAPTAFAQGIAIIADFEKNQHELNFGNMSERVDNFTFSTALSMLFLDIILYTLAGWYLDEVLPKQFGIQQPWYFPCQKDYWAGRGKINAKEAEAERLASLKAPEDEETPDIEDVPVELRRQEQERQSKIMHEKIAIQHGIGLIKFHKMEKKRIRRMRRMTRGMRE